MFERSEFLTLPIFDLHNWEAEGQWQRGRLSLLPFFASFLWRSKESDLLDCSPTYRATPDLLTDEQQETSNQS